jgi:signal transduction histidine kinase
MNAVLILWSGVAGAALTMGGAHGALWLLERRRLANLVFCIVAVAVAWLALTELGMMHAASPGEYGRWVWWFHLPNSVAVIGLVLFIHLEFGTAPAWLAALVVALRALILAMNFFTRPNVTWSEISSLGTISFLGEPVSVVASAVLRPTQWLATAASLLFIAYVGAALARAWRGERAARRRALLVCGGTLAFIVLATLESQLVVWGVLRMPVVVAPLFLLPMAAMTWEVSGAIVGSVRAERETARLREQLAHVARVHTISQLSGALAHELKQPLTSIMANAQAAQRMLKADEPDVAEVRAILADICDADRRADTIVERARAFMRRSHIEVQPVALGALVAEVLMLLEKDAVKQRVSLEVRLPGGLPPVRADRLQLSQVLLNLLVNAMEAVAAAGGEERWVRIEAACNGAGRVEVAVVDCGPGIPEDVLPRLFDAFVTTKQGGLGIGLALSRTIVQAHDGDLRAENNPGGGATFRFSLPKA